jgi:hypothetical protein
VAEGRGALQKCLAEALMHPYIRHISHQLSASSSSPYICEQTDRFPDE